MPIGSLYTDLSGSLGCARGTLFSSDDDEINDLRSEANLAAWYDASNSANLTVDSVGRVSQWNDTSTFASRHLLQGTAASQPIYLPWSGQNYVYLPGASLNYMQAAANAAFGITGDIDLRARLAPQTWTPATEAQIIRRQNGGSADYGLAITTTGFLRSLGSYGNIFSTVAVGFAANTDRWIRFTRVAASGTCQFFTSTDGVSWSQLGADVASAAGNITNGSGSVNIGTWDGTSSIFSGNVYRLQLLSGIAGTTVFDADPSTATDGASSFVDRASGLNVGVLSSGGKPAQIVGRASVLFDGVDDYLKTLAFTLNQPETVYFVGKQVSWTLDEIIYDGDNIASSGRMVLYQTTASPGLSMFAGTVLPVASLAVGSVGVVASVFNGASSLTTINRGTATTGNAGTNNGGGFTLGVEASTTGRWSNIQVSAVAIFAAAHDARTRARVINYLVSRYSIPV